MNPDRASGQDLSCSYMRIAWALPASPWNVRQPEYAESAKNADYENKGVFNEAIATIRYGSKQVAGRHLEAGRSSPVIGQAGTGFGTYQFRGGPN